MNKNIILNFGVFALVLFILTACFNPFDPLIDSSEGSGVVRIYIGDHDPASRTIQPGLNSIAGYQLTFEPHLEPVNITEGSYADVTLADGEWTITATAYLYGGFNYPVAAGSIVIEVENGIIVNGPVPAAIILSPFAGTDNGLLQFDISLEDIAEGSLTLWDINGYDKITDFADNGVFLSQSWMSSISSYYYLAPGRYIAEARLRHNNGQIAFLREVIEIWPGTPTYFEFNPLPMDFINSNAVLANSESLLLEINTKLNGVSIGAGTGSGASEQDPKTYTVRTDSTDSVQVELIFEKDSLFSTFSWTVTGSSPLGVYPNDGPLPVSINLSTNALWVKSVSEDGSKTMFYKFIAAPHLIPPPSNGAFTDTDYEEGFIAGSITWTRPAELDGIYSYRIYFGTSETVKWSSSPLGTTATAFIQTFNLARTELPEGVNYFLIYSRSETSDYPDCLAIPIIDLAMSPTSFGSSFTVTSTNPAGYDSGVSYDSPNLTINRSGTYIISGTSTNDRIVIDYWDDINVNIILNNVSINLSAIDNAIAFNANANSWGSVILNLTLQGENTLTSGNYQPGLRVPSNAAVTINGNGSLNATGGGQGGAGIGLNSYDSGAITITSGTITARGNWGSPGISGSVINIFGGTVNASGVTGGFYTEFRNGNVGIGGDNSVINITGGTVNAEGSFNVSGSNVTGNASIGGNNCTINISGGTVNAQYGIGGSHNRSGGIINISGGTVNANNYYGAAIGGGRNGAGGIITITGGIVTAETYISSSSNGSAGIGGGHNGAGGIITITGGIVKARGNNTFAIGRGSGAWEEAVLNIGNNAVIFANNMPDLNEGVNVNNSIVFIGNEGIMYGHVTLDQNLTIPSGRRLVIRNGDVLYTQGYTLTNEGIIFIENGSVIGTVTGNQPVRSALVISGDSAYTYREGILTITGSGSYTIGMRSGVTSTSADRIVVSPGITANITLSGVNIDMGIANTYAFLVNGESIVNLNLIGENILKSYNNMSNMYGIHAPEGTININGGVLTVTGGGPSGILYNEININDAVIFAGWIQPELAGGESVNNSIVFVNETGSMYGDFTLTQNITIQEGLELNILGGILTIPEGITLTNNGAINNMGVIINEHNITGSGTIIGYPPIVVPSAGSFTDTDYAQDKIGGTISWTLPYTGGITGYRIYWGYSDWYYGDIKLDYDAIFETTSPAVTTQLVPAGTDIPEDANMFFIFSYNENGESSNFLMVPIVDAIVLNDTYGAFNVTGNGNVSFSSNVLIIETNGTYVISGTSTADRIMVNEGLTDVNLTLSNLSIDVSAHYNACAIDITNAAVNITLTGTNNIKSGESRAGIGVPDGASLVITAGSSGSLNVTGGSNSAGIGGESFTDNRTHAGNISLLGGTINATGGNGRAGTYTAPSGNVTHRGESGGSGGGAGIGGGGGSGGFAGWVSNNFTAYNAGNGRNGGGGGTIIINGASVTATGGTGGGTAAIINYDAGAGGNGADIGGGGAGGAGGGVYNHIGGTSPSSGSGGRGGSASGTGTWGSPWGQELELP